MVLRAEGDVKLRRMDFLRSGDRVNVSASGSVRLVFFGDGHTEALTTPGTVTITESGGTPANLVRREKAKLPRSQLEGLSKLGQSARAGVARVRELDAPPLPNSPISGATVLGDRPRLVWAAVAGAGQYDVELFLGETDRKESLIWSGRTAKDYLEYPKDQPALERGEIYTWKVSAREKGPIALGIFTVAASDVAPDLASIRKLSESPDASDRLLAATLFETALVYDESHRLFADLAKQYPSEPWLMLACARHQARLGNIEEAKSMEKKARTLAGKSL